MTTQYCCTTPVMRPVSDDHDVDDKEVQCINFFQYTQLII